MNPETKRWATDPDGAPATLVAALHRNAVEFSNRIAFRERKFGIWQEQTWAEVLEEILALAAGLESHGLTAGAVMTLIGDNRPRLYYSMLAANMLRAIPSPAYPDIPLEELIAATKHGAPLLAIAEDQEQVDKLLELRAATGRPNVIAFDDDRGLRGYEGQTPKGIVGSGCRGLVSLDSLTETGKARLAVETGLRKRLLGAAKVDDIAILLHSSGTTGVPKGIPLSHGNAAHGVLNAAASGYFRQHDELFAYLPIAWVGDFAFVISAGVMMAGVINIPERQETVLPDLRAAAPTFYLAAPRAWDQMLTRIQVGMQESTPLKRKLFDFFMPRAVELEKKRLAGGAPSMSELLVNWFGDKTIRAPLRDWIGLSRCDRAYTGGEALGEDTFIFFRALGIKLKQFYGQTETCALTAAQQEGHVKLHTVGLPMQGVEVKLSDEGEILVRSPSVFSGYFDDPESSAKSLANGWLHTGDAGRIENDGELVVLGRVSEIVHTANGERYIPNFIENRLKFSPFIRNVAVMGAGRDMLTAIICIDFDAVGHWAEERAISYTSYADLSQKSQVHALIGTVVEHVNSIQPEGLRIRRFVNLHKDFDADDGEITRTRKLRRNVIETNYAVLIDALYAGDQECTYRAVIAYENGEKGEIVRNLIISEAKP